jgi:branched-chain amino acid transport system permease protein
VFTAVFVFGTALAGLAGVLAAPYKTIRPAMGETIIINSFVVVVLGGLGSFAGALVSAILIGLLNGLAFVYLPTFQPIIPFVLMAAVLLIRPAGLFGEVSNA